MKKTFVALFVFIAVTTAVFAQSEAPEAQRAKLINTCKALLGTPYEYAGVTPAGFDCSGFIYYSAKEALGLDLPRRSGDLHMFAESISDNELQAGDLLFFAADIRVNHVALYLGDDSFIHSASDGEKTGVIISGMDESYWNRTYVGAGRILPAADDARLAAALKEKKYQVALNRGGTASGSGGGASLNDFDDDDGYVSLDELDGDDEEWVSADEFLAMRQAGGAFDEESDDDEFVSIEDLADAKKKASAKGTGKASNATGNAKSADASKTSGAGQTSSLKSTQSAKAAQTADDASIEEDDEEVPEFVSVEDLSAAQKKLAASGGTKKNKAVDETPVESFANTPSVDEEDFEEVPEFVSVEDFADAQKRYAAQKKAEEERARVAAEQKRLAELEAQKAAEEERARVAAEQKRLAELEAQKAAEEERARVAAEQKRLAELEAQKAAEEERARVAAEQKRLAELEAQRLAEEERARVAAEQKRLAELEAQRLAEEERIAEQQRIAALSRVQPDLLQVDSFTAGSGPQVDMQLPEEIPIAENRSMQTAQDAQSGVQGSSWYDIPVRPAKKPLPTYADPPRKVVPQSETQPESAASGKQSAPTIKSVPQSGGYSPLDVTIIIEDWIY